MNHSKPPQADGLYDPSFEHDACGVAMVARLDNAPGHDVVVKALEALDNLEHRGAEGADIRTGDGAGILVQLPHAFLRSAVDFELPSPGRYGVAMCFLPEDATHRRKIEELFPRLVQRRRGGVDDPSRCRPAGSARGAVTFDAATGR